MSFLEIFAFIYLVSDCNNKQQCSIHIIFTFVFFISFQVRATDWNCLSCNWKYPSKPYVGSSNNALFYQFVINSILIGFQNTFIWINKKKNPTAVNEIPTSQSSCRVHCTQQQCSTLCTLPLSLPLINSHSNHGSANSNQHQSPHVIPHQTHKNLKM